MLCNRVVREFSRFWFSAVTPLTPTLGYITATD